MRLSIVIPTLNEEKNIRKCLSSLRLEGKERPEVIVANSCKTTDGTIDIVREYGAKTIDCQECGRAAQMNKGASESKGDVILFLHADVQLPMGYEEDIVHAINEGNDFGFFSYRFDSKSPLLKINSHFTRYKGIFTGGGDQALFIRREAWEQLGGFDEACEIMEDFDLFRRAKRKKMDFTIVDNDLIVSARKYDNHNYVYVNLVNLAMMLMFWSGLSYTRLKKFYKYCLS